MRLMRFPMVPHMKVDKTINSKDNSPMLVFQDDGGGMDPEGVRKCMSLGFSTKKSKTANGQHGNGFKTSTMRLGADAIVFTRAIRGSNVTLSVGLLSYTFLRKTVNDDIVVPMLDFQIQDGHIVPLVYDPQGDWDNSLKIILDWSPFSSKEEILQQLCLKLALLATLPECYGGLNGRVVYIDTESKFSSRRMIEIGQKSFPQVFRQEGLAQKMAGRILRE